MPRIPIIPPRDGGAGGTGGGSSPEALPPEQADALRALEARTARIDRELAVAQSWRAAVDRLAEAEDAEDGPPPGFTRSFLDDADKERAALLKTLPAGRQSDLEDDLLSLRSFFGDRAAQAEASGLAQRRRSGLYRALDEYRQGVKRDPGLYDEAVLRLDGLSGDLGLPEDRITAMRHELRDALGNAAVDGLMANPERTVRVLSDGLFDDALSDASKARRLSEAQTAAAKNTLHTREQAVSGLATQARQGTAPDEAILAAERDGALGAAEAARLRDANAKAAGRATTRDARIQRVATLTEPLDPTNPEDRAAASDYWDSVAEVYASNDAEQQRDNELAFIERMGVLPDGLARKYQGALLSMDPTLAVAGATALADLQKSNPALVADIPPARMRMATAIAEFAVLDLPPERAIELAEQEIARSDPSVRTGSDPQTGAAEAVEPAIEEDGSTDADATSFPDDGVDQTDGPSNFGDEQDSGSRSEGGREEAWELSDEEVDALLRRDGLMPIPRGDDAPEQEAIDEDAPPLSQFVGTLWNEFLAARQWISPDTTRYDKLGRYVELDAGAGYIDESGQPVLIDPNRHAVLIDPKRGELSVYRRTLETEENRLLSLGRILGMGSAAGPLGTTVSAGARGAQALSTGRAGSATTLGSGIGPTGKSIAGTISGAAKGEAWVVEKAIPGAGQGAGSVHTVTKSGKATYASEGTALFMTHKEPVAADVLKTGRPLGLADDATFSGFKTILREEGAKLPPDTSFAIRGSAVTGNGFDDTAGAYTKEFFDVGRTSDHDIAIVSRTLFEKARESGVKLRQGGTRTDVLGKKKTSDLGLSSLLERVRELTNRKKTEFMIYKSVDALNKRGGNMQFDLK